tara:strand:+ start:21531 stop:22064 length:534 start_codon:yes stop_codon:yes gene_type:complete
MEPISLAISLASRFAPGLVRRLVGPGAGDVADQIFSMGRSITGATSPEEVAAALDANVEHAATFRAQAAELDADLEKAYLADRANARDMRLELAKMGKTDWMMYGVGGVVVVGFVATVLTAFLVTGLSESQQNLVFSLAGLLGAMSSQVVSYFFGSSRGSSNKTVLMSLQDRGRGNA